MVLALMLKINWPQIFEFISRLNSILYICPYSFWNQDVWIVHLCSFFSGLLAYSGSLHFCINLKISWPISVRYPSGEAGLCGSSHSAGLCRWPMWSAISLGPSPEPAMEGLRPPRGEHSGGGPCGRTVTFCSCHQKLRTRPHGLLSQPLPCSCCLKAHRGHGSKSLSQTGRLMTSVITETL